MPKQTLKQNLTKLRAQLANPEELDEDTRLQLAEVADTIERILEEPPADYREAYDNIENVALGFEARHPRFARILSDITDAIAKLGI